MVLVPSTAGTLAHEHTQTERTHTHEEAGRWRRSGRARPPLLFQGELVPFVALLTLAVPGALATSCVVFAAVVTFEPWPAAAVALDTAVAFQFVDSAGPVGPPVLATSTPAMTA
jgi:hypothetical protein